MADQLSKAQNEVLNDLLVEKSLWSIYWKPRNIKFSRLNLAVGFAVFVGCFVFSLSTKSATQIIDQIVSLSTITFSTSIVLLGFLLAGFSFFATVADKKLFFKMAESQHKESGLSFLKYNFFSFMRVFAEYLAFALLTFILLLALNKNSGCHNWLAESFGDLNCRGVALDKAVANIFLSGVAAAFAYLLMQLKSFIYNIYHIVMTSIYWELLKAYECESRNSPNNDGIK